MVKKSIVAIALMGILATVSFAQDAQVNGQFKVDGQWPSQYIAIDICKIPIVMDIGMFIEIIDCNKKKIVLKQVTCPQGQSFPCYKGCTDIEVRANFAATIGTKLYDTSNGIISDFFGNKNWKAYYKSVTDPNAPTSPTWPIPGDGNKHKVSLCVEAWDANIYAHAPGSDDCKTAVSIGQVAVTAMPQAAWVQPGKYCPPVNPQ